MATPVIYSSSSVGRLLAVAGSSWNLFSVAGYYFLHFLHFVKFRDIRDFENLFDYYGKIYYLTPIADVERFLYFLKFVFYINFSPARWSNGAAASSGCRVHPNLGWQPSRMEKVPKGGSLVLHGAEETCPEVAGPLVLLLD